MVLLVGTDELDVPALEVLAGSVAPVEPGRVEEILIEEGNMVKKGDVILRISNDNLLLEITNNEAQVVRAINDVPVRMLNVLNAIKEQKEAA